MNVKQSKWSPLKEMLFTYLAVTKILYWFNTFMAMNFDDIGEVGRAVLMRLLNQDLIMIVFIIIMFYIERKMDLAETDQGKILKRIVFYFIGYIVLVGTYILGFLLINIFATIQINWAEFFGYTIAGYIVVAVVLSINDHFKAKEKAEKKRSLYSEDDKLYMLNTLRENGILTQEEFDAGKGRLAGLSARA